MYIASAGASWRKCCGFAPPARGVGGTRDESIISQHSTTIHLTNLRTRELKPAELPCDRLHQMQTVTRDVEHEDASKKLVHRSTGPWSPSPKSAPPTGPLEGRSPPTHPVKDGNTFGTLSLYSQCCARLARVRGSLQGGQPRAADCVGDHASHMCERDS